MSFVESARSDLRLEFEPRPEAYSRAVRIAVLLGLSTGLWSVIIVGGWGLYSLLA
jgi:hypothetical protein